MNIFFLAVHSSILIKFELLVLQWFGTQAYSLKEKEEKQEVAAKPVEVKEAENEAIATSTEAVVEKSDETPVAAAEETKEDTPAPTVEESTESPASAEGESNETAPAVTEENSENTENSGEEQAAEEEAPEIKVSYFFFWIFCC